MQRSATVLPCSLITLVFLLAIALPAAAQTFSANNVMTGLGNTCATTTAGGLKCWGTNTPLGPTMSLLGTADAANPVLQPSDVVGLTSGIASASFRGTNQCAIMTDGALKCRGDNTRGQAGLGTSNTTEGLNTVPGMNGALGVGVGASHVCAVTAMGGLKCWGDNFRGQLGYATVNTVHGGRSPLDVDDLASGVVAVSAGNLYTCALTTAGGVKCWGYNEFGQIGGASDRFSFSRAAPGDVPGLTSGAASISAGNSHTCAVTSAGGVKCWGLNNVGQLGDNGSGSRSVAADVSGLTSGIASVSSAGGLHTCAVTTAGGLKCWGLNNFGQLGDGTTTTRRTPVDVIGLSSGVASVSTNDQHTCVVMTSGAIKCWGYNGSGQLGDGTLINRSSPFDTIGFGGGPGQPINVVATAGGGQISITFSAGPDGGSAISAYTATCTAPGQPTRIVTINAPPVAAIVVPMLTSGVAYSCFVTATNANGIGPASVSVSATPTVPATVAGAPTIGTLIPGDGQITVSFTAPMSNGGATIISYMVTCGAISVTGFTSPITVTGLANDVAAICSVIATNSVGNSASSATGSVSPSAAAPLTLISVVSRKTHGSAGTFDLAIDTAPIGGAVTAEPRGIGSGHTLVFQFNLPVSAVGAVTVSPAGTGAAIAAGYGVVVTLTNLTDNQRTTISLASINGAAVNLSLTMGFLVGDVNNTRSVNASDISGVKARSGQVATSTNFRFDVNATGAVNASDISAVKARSGLVLPTT